MLHREKVEVEVNYPSTDSEARMVSVEDVSDSEHGVVDLLLNSLDSSDKNYAIGGLEMLVAPNFIS